MSEIWGNPASWTPEQWLAVVILIFVVVAIIVLVLRLNSIIRMAGRSNYKPKLRRFRTTTYRHHRSASNDDDRQD
jgi:NADH:ubiquinone oxidoreductase subunit 3 (subunit A)